MLTLKDFIYFPNFPTYVSGASLTSSFPLGLNPNLNVPLDMGVGGGSCGGGSVAYKEPHQSRLKKLWATDPLEQNSKSGKY